MLDNFIVFGYLLIILFIGMYFRKKSNNLQEYGAVGKDIRSNRFILIATIFATSVGGGTTFGISEKAFSSNLAYSYGLMLTVSFDVLIAFYIVPRIIKFYGAITVGDIIVQYYGRLGKIITGLAAAIVSIGYLAAQINVSGRIFEYFLDIEYLHGVLISYAIIILYTTLGGLRSVVITDILQFLIMTIAIPLVMFISLYKIGGFSELYNKLEVTKYSLNDHQMIIDIIIAALGFSVMGLYPTFIQRILINKNPKIIQAAIYNKIGIYIIFISIITIVGLNASILVPELQSPLAIPYMIDSVIPIGLKGIVISGLLASVMSTADSDLNVASISLIQDVFQPLMPNVNKNYLLIIAQATTIILGVLGIFIALHFRNAVDLVIFVAGFWSPLIFVPLIAILYNIIIPRNAFIFAIFTGIMSFMVWEIFFIDFYKLKSVFVGTIANLIVFTLSALYQKIKRSNH